MITVKGAYLLQNESGAEYDSEQLDVEYPHKLTYLWLLEGLGDSLEPMVKEGLPGTTTILWYRYTPLCRT